MYTAICLVFFIQLTFVYADIYEGTCPEGYYGEKCELECSETCRPVETYPCNKETGKCAEGCKSGYFGKTCERKCNCSETCIQETGACIGNQTPRPQDQNEKCVKETSEERTTDVWMIVAIILIVVIVVLVVTFLGFILRKRLFRKQKKSSGDEMKSLIKTKQRQSIEQKGPNGNDVDEVKRLQIERTRVIAAYNRILKHNGLLPDSTFYHLEKNTFKKDIWLQCPTLDCKLRTNTEGHGNAVNKKDSVVKKDDHQNLRNCVTTTNSIKHTGFPQYFELVFHIRFDEPLEETKQCLEITIYSGENKGKANTICIRLGICSTCPKPSGVF